MIFILDDIRSAFNVGSIFRLADAVGAQVICCGISPTPGAKWIKGENLRVDKVGKTALGAEKTVKWERFDTVSEAITKLRKKDPNVKIYAVENDVDAESALEVGFPKSLALIFGHEKKGISEETKKLSDKVVKIPMYGKKRSLNVAMAAGITAYEVVRQWEKRKEHQGKERKQTI